MGSERGGSRLGGFRLGAVVGEGASSRVYRAVEEATGRVVALKRLDPDPDLEDATARFVQEAELLARLDHPRVVRHVAHGVDDDGAPWLALEWLEGLDLAERQRVRPLSAPDSVEAMRQALEALEALHDAGIVHRDIKPANFFLVRGSSEKPLAAAAKPPPLDPKTGLVAGEDPEVISLKLLDLGVARTVEDLDTLHDLRIGTPAYMSPEQAAGSARVGPTSDLYGVAVVLFELLTGERPHESDDPLALLAKIVLEPARRLRALLPEAPEELDALLARALSKRPADRPASAAEMARALRGIEVRDLARGVRRASMSSAPPTATLPRTEDASMSGQARVVTGLFARIGAGEHEAVEAIGDEHAATTHRLLGNRLVLLFGARRATGDEPLRAARAALAIRAAIPHAQLALATGRAVTGGEGLAGEVVDAGIRALDDARSVIRLDEASARLLGSHFVVSRDAHGLLLGGERPLSTVAEPRLLGHRTAFVDRERELSALLDVLDQARAGERSRAAVVLGQAGLGKSRLRYELLRQLDEEVGTGARFSRLILRGDPTVGRVPLGVVTHALRRKAGVRPRQLPELRRRAAASFVETLGLSGDPALVMELLGAGDPSAPRLRSLRADAAAMARALREALIGVFEAWLRGGPLLVVVEDLQWVDSRTIDVLERAIEQLAAQPFALVAFGRPESLERYPALFAAADPARVELRPVSREAATSLVREQLGDDVEEPLVRSIVRRAAGNPLFLEELIRAASEGRSDDLPLAIQAAFQVRIDELPEPARDALLAASVAGRVTWREALGAQLGETPIDLVLDVLRQWEVMEERPTSRFEGTRELVVRHALLRDVAYAMLPDERRRSHHLALAEWLAEAGEDDATLAHHFEEGGDDASAAERYARAAERALSEDATALALEHAERGLALDTDADQAAHLRLIAARACHRRGRYDDAVAHAEQGLARATEPDDVLRLSGAHALTLRRLGDVDASLRALDGALERAGDAASLSARAEARSERAWTLYNGGRPAEAAAEARAVLAMLPDEAPDLVGVELSARHALARALHDLGALDESLALHREVVTRGEALHHHWRAEGARHGLGQVLSALGRPDEAAAELERARDAGRRLGLPSTEGYAQLFLAMVRFAQGSPGAQAEAARGALAVAEQLHAAPLAAGAKVLLAIAELDLGDTAQGSARAAGVEADDDAPGDWRMAARALGAVAMAGRGEREAAREEAERVRQALGAGAHGSSPAVATARRLVERLDRLA